MANLKPIKWRPEDTKKLSRAVQKFNTSITKLSQKNPEIAEAGLYPDKISVKQLRERILTRSDFNREIASINRWFKPKARDIITLEGIKMTRYAYKEALYRYQSQLHTYNTSLKEAHDNLRKQAQLGQKPLSPMEKLKQITKAREDKSDYNYQDEENLQKSWAVYQMKLAKRSNDKYYEETNRLYYTNYMASLDENFTKEHANDIQALMYTLQLTGYEMYLLTTINPDLDIEYIYGPEEEEKKYQYIYENIYKTYWRAVKEGLMEMR